MRRVQRWWTTPARIAPRKPKRRAGQLRSGAGRSLWQKVYRTRIEQGLEHCRWCEFVTDSLTFDHLIPYSRGGNAHFTNMTLLCPSCNQLKADQLWDELISLHAEEALAPPERRWFQIAAAEAQARSSVHRPCTICHRWWREAGNTLEPHRADGRYCPGGRITETDTEGNDDGRQDHLV